MSEPNASVPKGNQTEDAMNRQPADSSTAPVCACARGDLSGVEPVIATMATSAAVREEVKITDPNASLPKGKQTVLGLYVTAKEAYEKWKAEPDKVKIIDVRTPEEYLFVGHPTMAWKIPVAVQIYEWDHEKTKVPDEAARGLCLTVKEMANPTTRSC